MAGFSAPKNPLKVAGLIDFKKPKPAATTAPATTSPFQLGGTTLGSGPLNPTTTQPTFGGVKSIPTVSDILGSVPGQKPAVPVQPSQPAQPGIPQVAGIFSTPSVPAQPAAAPALSPAEIADRARAQGSAAGAASSLAANTATGQANQQVSAAAMNAASGQAAAAPRPLTDAEIADRARAQGSAKGAADSLAANEAAGKQSQRVGAAAMAAASGQADKAASVKPQAANPSAPAAPAPGSPQADLETLRTAAANAMNAKEDPVAKREFNRAILQIGMANQAQRDALKMQIAQDPALNGQLAGTAVLMSAAQAAGAQVDDLIASLSIESAKRIQDLNEWGFDKLSKITEYRISQAEGARKEMLAAGDYDGYAKAFKEATGMDVDVKALKTLSPATQTAIENLSAAMNRNVASGNMEAAKRNFAAIQALSPEAFGQLTFDDVITAPDAYKAQSEQKAGLWESVRTQMAQGQTADALAGLDALYPDKAKQETDGAAAIASSDLATINEALKAAGMTPVSDKSELIGRGDDVFKAMQLATIAKEAGSTAIDKGVEMLQGELQKLGYDPTKPEEARALRSYVLNLQLNGGLRVNANGELEMDPNSLIPPWDPRSTEAHLFSDWPVLAADGTTVMDPGGDPYGTDNPRPAPDSARGQYYADLDAKWENYLAKTPTADRFTRDQWFYATSAGTQNPDPSKIPPSLQPEKPDASDPLAFESILQGVRTGSMVTPDQETALLASGRLPRYTPSELFQGDPGGLIAQNDGLVVVKDHVIQIRSGSVEIPKSGGSLLGGKIRIPVVANGKAYTMDSSGIFYLPSSNTVIDPWKKEA